VNIQKEFRCDFKLNIFIFSMIYWKPTNLFKQKRMTCLKLGLESASKVRKQKKKIISLRVTDSIYYKKLLMLLGTYMVTFNLLILQELHIK